MYTISCTHGFPISKQLLDPVLRGYWEVHSRLTHSDDIISLDQRTVIPQKLQKQVLQHFHFAHQGITSMKARANQCGYWPEMSKSIKNYGYNCTTCGLITPSHKAEPIRITLFPDWPFQQICANFFVLHSHTYLIITDRYSGWITIYDFKWRSHHFIYWKDLQSVVHHFWSP